MELLYQVLLGLTFYSSCFWSTFKLWGFGEKVVSGELGSFILYFLPTFVPDTCPVILSSDFPAAAAAAAVAPKSLQSCPTLCDPIDGSPPGSAVPGILQAITLEWVAISFSNAWKWKVKVKSLSRVQLLAIPWTAAYQAPPSMGLSRQVYWSGVPFPCPSDFPTPSQFISQTFSLEEGRQWDCPFSLTVLVTLQSLVALEIWAVFLPWWRT